MGTPSPTSQDRPFFRSQSVRLSLPHRSLSHHERAGLDPSDSAAGILFSHPSARVVQLAPPPSTVRAVSNPLPADLDYPVDAIETLPWTSASETTAASGLLVIEKVKGSTNFLKSGRVMHGIMRNSQCWCVDGESKFVLRYGKFLYYRIELPSETDEDKAKIAEFIEVLKKILRFEVTPCPFKRGFHVELPESAITPRRRGTWKKREISHSLTPSSSSPRSNGSTRASRWAAQMARRETKEAKNEAQDQQVDSDSSDDHALDHNIEYKGNPGSRLSIPGTVDRAQERSGHLSPEHDDEESVDLDGMSEPSVTGARPESSLAENDIDEPDLAVDMKEPTVAEDLNKQKVADIAPEGRVTPDVDIDDRKEYDDVDRPLVVEDTDKPKITDDLDKQTIEDDLDERKEAGAEAIDKRQEVDEADEEEVAEVSNERQERKAVDGGNTADDVERRKQAPIMDEQDVANEVDNREEAKEVDERYAEDDAKIPREVHEMDKGEEADDVEIGTEAHKVDEPQEEEEEAHQADEPEDEHEAHKVDEPEEEQEAHVEEEEEEEEQEAEEEEAHVVDEPEEAHEANKLYEPEEEQKPDQQATDNNSEEVDDMSSSDAENFETLQPVNTTTEQDRQQLLEVTDPGTAIAPRKVSELATEPEVTIEPDRNVAVPNDSSSFSAERGTATLPPLDSPIITGGFSRSGSDSPSTERNDDDLEEDALADPDHFPSDTMSVTSSVTSFHSLAPFQSRDSFASLNYVLSSEDKQPSPPDATQELDFHKSRSRDSGQHDTEPTVSSSSPGMEFSSEPKSSSSGRPSTSTSDRPSTPVLGGSSASDSSWPEIQTPSGPYNNAELRQRQKVRRSLSPLPSSSVLAPEPQRSQDSHFTTGMLYRAGSIALRKPIEMVFMLVHIMARVAAGATVNDLLSGDLFRNPDYFREQNANRNLPDQLDERRHENWEEDDFRFSNRARRPGSGEGKPLDDADSLD